MMLLSMSKLQCIKKNQKINPLELGSILLPIRLKHRNLDCIIKSIFQKQIKLWGKFL